MVFAAVSPEGRHDERCVEASRATGIHLVVRAMGEACEKRKTLRRKHALMTGGEQRTLGYGIYFAARRYHKVFFPSDLNAVELKISDCRDQTNLPCLKFPGLKIPDAPAIRTPFTWTQPA